MDKDSILRAAEAMAEQIEDPGIQPEPVPTSVHVSRGENFIALTFMTPIGGNTFFLDYDSSQRLALSLERMAKKI